MKHFFSITLMCVVGSTAHADIFHYNNVIIGDRAIGLGGAYAGVSDDASGIAYNPAGIAYAISNDLSGSANAYYTRKTVYKQILPGLDFEERSEGMVPSFFGGIQKLDSVAKGLVAGFAVYSPDNEVKDQDDSIKNTSKGVESFHRAVKVTASTLHMAAAAAYRFNSSLSLGMSLGFINTNELNQDFQSSVLRGSRCLSDGATCYLTTSSGRRFLVPKTSHDAGILRMTMANHNQKLIAQALEPTLGAQYVLGGSLVFGFSAKLPVMIKENFEKKSDQLEVFRFYDGHAVTQDDLLTPSTAQASTFYQPKYFSEVSFASATPLGNGQKAVLTTKKPLKGLPYTLRGGVAWFATPKILWTADATYHTAADQAELDAFKRSAILNYATGLEYYVLPSMPVRVGMFTNNDARPKLDKNKVNTQVENVDFLGGSFYLSWAESSSQFGGGAVYQMGSGKANKVSGSLTQQDVQASSLILAFSASHQL